jgi:flagellum-specific peptidoglycan hydrolase FlgJ
MAIAPDIVEAARRAQALCGIPASVLLAQYGLESAWGRRTPPGSCNPFGEKALPGQAAVAAATHEVVGDETFATKARFLIYASLGEAFAAHARHLATSAHYAAARAVLPDAEGFCRGLNGVYATDPEYADKLIAIIRSGDLTRYDAPLAQSA